MAKELSMLSKSLQENLDLTAYSQVGHTHDYAGSNTAGGAANTAVKLHTARTINGTSFDGSGNITTANWGTARNITIGDSSKSVNGSGNVSWTLTEIGAFPISGGTVTGDTSFNKYLSVNAWPGYGSGSVDMWYDGTYSDNTGALTLNKSIYTTGAIENNNVVLNAWPGYGTGYADIWYDGDNKTVRMDYISTLQVGNNKVYHEGYKPTPNDIGAAAASHGTHVTYATATPKAPGTAAIGSVNRVAREDHVHPLQTTVSGNAGSADKLSTARTITIGNKSNTFDGTANITYTLSDIGAKATEPTTFRLQSGYVAVRTAGRTAAQHYEFWDSDDVGWASIKAGAIYDNNNRVYSASNKPTLSDLGAAAASHGTHVTYSTTAPKVAGTAAIGSESAVARGDHVHAAQTSVSGNAGTATKLQTARDIKIGNATKSFNGTANVEFTLAEIGIGSSISAVASNLSGVTINSYDSILSGINTNIGKL